MNSLNGSNNGGRGRDICLRTFQLAVEVVRLCRKLDARPGVDRTLARQLLRSGTSIGANVEEAQAGQSPADFVSKYCIALKEARETHYWLRLLVATEDSRGFLDDGLLQEVDEITRILASIVVNIKKNLMAKSKEIRRSAK